jgi:hypothetical protein
MVVASGTVLAQQPEETGIAAAEPSPLDSPRRFGLGLYPGMSGVLGFPNLTSYQGSLYLSFSDLDRYSFFIGYGEERGSDADSEIYTLGWGGVRRLHSGAPQRGFYGRFLRYRRWDHRDHGLHHGLSFGTETGVGFFSFTWELGAARSDRNHWIATAQVGLKIAIPVYVPLGARALAVPEYNQRRER